MKKISVIIFLLLLCVLLGWCMLGSPTEKPVSTEEPSPVPKPTNIELISFYAHAKGVQSMTITSALLIAAVGAVMSILASYVPKFNTWYAALLEEQKKLIMLAALVVISAFIILSSCMGWWTWIECSKAGLLKYIEVFVEVLVLLSTGNQTAYSLTPQTRAVKEAKLYSKAKG